ncbi:MAG: hypothetical protein U0163_00120 [Gemmatimonadaceae bacterium]
MRTFRLRVCTVLLGILVSNCGADSNAVPQPPSPPSRSAQSPSAPPPPGARDISRADFPWPLPVDAAERILLETTLFEFGAIPHQAVRNTAPMPGGRNGFFPGARQIQAFNLVLDQPDALARFVTIAGRATPAGRLYALCGLQELSGRDAEAAAHQLTQSTGAILVCREDNCLMTPIREFVVDILANRMGATFRQSQSLVDAYFKPTG